MYIPFKKRLMVSAISSGLLAFGVAGYSAAAWSQAPQQEAAITVEEESHPEAPVVSSRSKAGSTSEKIEELIVVGARTALESASELKRHANTVMDSITATDVGALPDKSVAEALQRMPGITVSRFSASNDTQHFSAEPSGVVVRGLEQVRSEFNGRDTFSADSSRGLSWEDISPELMQRIDVYKNQRADLIEGGIGGLVDLRTRVPFDFDEPVFSASAEVNYSEVADSYNPNVSALYSNRWSSDIGQWGLLGQIASSRLNTRSEGIYLGRMGIHAPGYFEMQSPDGSAVPLQEETYVPTFIAARDNLYDRERIGGALAAQWQSNDDSLVATVQFNRSEYEQVNTEYSSLNWIFALWGRKASHVIEPGWVDGAGPEPGSYLTFGKDRSFLSGGLTSGLGWWGSDEMEAGAFGVNSNGIPLVNPSGCGWGASPEYTEQYCQQPYDRRGVSMETNSRRITNESMTQDLSFNLKWSPSDVFRANFDLQTVDATNTGYGTAGALNSYTGMQADFSGSLPRIHYSDPLNVNLAEGGLRNPNAWNYSWLQDHQGKSNGESIAFKADGEYDLEKKWFESLRFGVRTVSREQNVKQAWNFRGITSRWESAAYYNTDKTAPIDKVTNLGEETFFAGYPSPDISLEHRAFHKGYMGGGVMDSTELLYISPAFLGNPALVNQYFDRANLGIGEFHPICSGSGAVRASEILDANGNSTCFTPGETLKVKEDVNAAYLMLNFGGDEATLGKSDIRISGNVGVRYVETHTKSYGSIGYGNFNYDQLDCFQHMPPSVVDPDNPYVPPSTNYSAGCYVIGAAAHNATVPGLPDTVDDGNGNMVQNPAKVYLPDYIIGSRDDIAFHDGSFEDVTGDKKFRHVLPSVNIKLDITDNTIVRMAYSKAMSRPDFSMYRYAADIREPGIDVSYLAQCKVFNSQSGAVEQLANCEVNPELTFDSQGNLAAARPRYEVNTGNPRIAPITADNFDISFEHYFSGAGLVSLNVFQKNFKNYITHGTSVERVTNNGVTRDLYINSPLNGEGASIWGYEINTQKFMDFLPAPFDGIGFQANYTKVFNRGIENVNYDSGSDFYVKTTALQGMSEDAYNLVLMYEKGPFAFRTAYNWRSEYLVTANDCCNLPVWQGDQGFLDASLRYRFSDHFEVNMQFSNILDTTTRLFQQVSASDAAVNPEHTVPTAWFKSDRRVSLGLRMKY